MPSNMPPGVTEFDYSRHNPNAKPVLDHCRNCGAECDESDLAWVEQFEYLGCASCLAEAVAILAAELDPETGCTVEEIEAIPVLEPIALQVVQLTAPEFTGGVVA